MVKDSSAALLPNPKETLKVNIEKWGTELVQAGWTFLPNILFLRQVKLGLDSLDLNILIVLLSFWWQADQRPFPSKKTIANTIGCDVSTVRRRIQKMEAGKLITRIERRVANGRSKTNEYDFSGLIKAAIPLALEEMQARENQREEKAKRLRSKSKPQLTVAADNV